MRTRKEIIESVYEDNGGDEYYMRAGILEVLLDIRDLLTPSPEESN